MIKLITIDLDGTLLTDDKQLPPDFWEVVDVLSEKGVSIAIASGRPFHNISSLFDRMKDRIYFACDNGTYVVYNEKELLVNPLPSDSIPVFLEIARELDQVYPVMCGKDLAFIQHDIPEFKAQALKYYREYRKVDDLQNVDDLILKISFCDLVNAETNSYPFYKRFENDFSIAVSGKIWLDITGRTGTKGFAIQKIQEHLNVSPAETLAFGDYLNDLDMIQNAGYSYAMKNAHEGILKAAKYVTKYNNNEYGVTKVIKELFKI